MTTPNQARTRSSEVICVRFPTADLALVKAAQQIMTDGTLSAFVRSATLCLARAILEAADDLGERRPGMASCDTCRTGDATLEERKP